MLEVCKFGLAIPDIEKENFGVGLNPPELEIVIWFPVLVNDDPAIPLIIETLAPALTINSDGNWTIILSGDKI